MESNSNSRSSKISPISVFKGTSWAIYMSSSGKKYYFNSESNSSRWEVPSELKDIKPTPIKSQSCLEGSIQNNRINGRQNPEKTRETIELEHTLSSIKIPQIELPYIEIPEKVDIVSKLPEKDRNLIRKNINLDKYHMGTNFQHRNFNAHEEQLLEYSAECMRQTLMAKQSLCFNKFLLQEDIENHRLVCEIQSKIKIFDTLKNEILK